MNLLCLAVDRLHAGYLGCYGNTWVATPALDRLAAGGFVFDQAIVDTLDPTAAYDSWWRGSHVAARNSASSNRPTFAGVARRAGLKTLLVADDARVLEHPAGVDFDEVLECLPPPVPEVAADDVLQTHTAQFFAEAGDRLRDLAQPFAMWLHLGALGGAWDAPLAFRERFRDEDDPPVPIFATLPHRTAPPELDLDERFGYAQAYAGQVALVDACLGGLLEQLEEANLDGDTAVVVCGLRGLALGEHGAVGHADDRLYSENVHVPWLVRLPDGRARLRRSQALVQPSDWLATAADWLGVALEGTSRSGRSLAPLVDGTAATVRDRAVSLGSGEFAFRTARWSLRVNDRAELFAKPDDFWEVNDVASRCPEVVDALQTSLQETTSALAGELDPPPLPEAERMLEA